MSQIRKHSIKGITDVLASTDAASKGYVDNADKVISSSGFDYSEVGVDNSFSSVDFTDVNVLNAEEFLSEGSLIFSDDNFFFASSGQPLIVSTNGVTWTKRTVPNNFVFKALTYGNGLYVGGSSSSIVISTDTIVWQLRTASLSGLSVANSGLTYGNGLYVGASGNTLNSVVVSTDATVWMLRTSGGTQNPSYGSASVLYGNGVFVLSHSQYEISSSTDTIVWTRRTGNWTSGLSWEKDGKFVGNRFYLFATGGGSPITTSTDGTIWSRASNTDYFVNQSPTFGQDKYVGYGYKMNNSSDHGVLISDDGFNWKKVYSGQNTAFRDSANGNAEYLNNVFLISDPDTTEYLQISRYLEPNSGRFLFSDYDSIFVKQQVNLPINSPGPFDAYPTENLFYANGYYLQQFYWSSDDNLNQFRVSTDAITWIARTARASASYNYYHTYGQGYYVSASVATNSNILQASTDTIVWELRTTGITGDGNLQYQGFSYGNGNYVVVQSLPRVLSSTDTIVWQLRTSSIAFGGGFLRSRYGGGYHILHGSSGSFVVSTDTVHWTKRTTTTGSGNISYYGYGNGIHLISSSSSLTSIQTSTDTIVWIDRTVPNTPSNNIEYDSVYKKYFYYNVSLNGFVESTDGVQWELEGTNFPNTFTRDISGYVYNDDDKIAVAIQDPLENSDADVFTKKSVQQKWESRRDDEFSVRGFKEFTVPGDYTFIIPSGSNNYYIELIGGGGGGATARNYYTAFNTHPGPGGGPSIYQSHKITRSQFGDANTLDIRVGSGGLGGDFGGCTSSTDGNTWESVVDYDYFTSSVNTTFYHITYANGLYVLVAQSGRILVSTDSNTWQVRTSGTTNTISGSAYGDGIYALSASADTLISTDTVVWIKRTSGVTSTKDIIYANNNFVLSGTSGQISVSSDGTIWQKRTTPGSSSFDRVRYSESDFKYFSSSSGLEIIDSTDTIVWTARTSGLNITSSSNDVNYVNGLYILTVRETISVSTDFVSWVQRTAPYTDNNTSIESLGRGIVYFNNQYVLGGSWTPPQYLVSTDTIVWESRKRQLGVENTIPNKSSINDIVLIQNRIFILSGSVRNGNAGNNSYCQWVNNNTTRQIFSDRGDGANANSISSGSKGTPNQNTFVNGYISGETYLSRTVGSAIPRKIYTTGLYEILGGLPGEYDPKSESDEITTYYYGQEYVQKTLPSIVAPGTYWTESPRESFTTSRALTYGKYSYTSEGGNEWTLSASGVINNINSITSSPGEYLAVGTEVLQSTDTINWTLRTAQSSYNTAHYATDKVVYDDSSTSGIQSLTNWIKRTASFVNSGTILTLNHANEFFFYSENASPKGIYASTDGIVWKARTFAIGGGTISFYQFNYFNGIYFALGPDIGVSTDSIIWTLRTLGSSSIAWPRGIAYSDRDGLYGLASGFSSNLYHVSTDTIHWSARTVIVNQALETSAYGNGYYLVNSNNYFASSTDSIVWEIRTAYPAGNNLSNTLLFSDKDKLFLSAAAILQVSTDTIVWQARTSGSSFEGFDGVSYDKLTGVYYISGNTSAYPSGSIANPYVYNSTDTIVWLKSSATIDNINDSNNLSNVTKVASSAGKVAYTQKNRILTTVDYAYEISPKGYLASGTTGKIDTSTDTISWTSRTSGITETFNEIISADPYESVIEAGSEWTLRTSLVTIASSTFMSYENGIFITGRDNKILQTSTNGITWTSRTTSIGAGFIFEAVYGQGLYLISGQGGGLSASTDLIVWTARTIASGQDLTALSYSPIDNLFFTSGENTFPMLLSVSTDTIHWNLRTLSWSGSIERIVSVPDSSKEQRYVIGGGNGGSSTISTSTDSIVWTLRTALGRCWGLSYNNGYYFAGFQSGGFQVSTDAIVWISRTTGSSFTMKNVGYYVNGLYYASGYESNIYSSTDTIHWKPNSIGLTGNSYIKSDGTILVVAGATSQAYNRPGYKNQPYVAVGENQNILTSTNQINWSLRTSGLDFGYDIKSIDYAPQTYLAGGGLDYAPLGDLWTLRTSGLNPGQGTGTIVYGGLYATSNSGRLITSTDTVVWTIRTSLSTAAIQDIIFENSIYLYCDFLGAIGHSTDAINWTLRTSGLLNIDLNALTYGNGVYVVGGNSSSLATSTDTIHWIIGTGYSTSGYNGLSFDFDNNLYLSAASDGVGVSSDAISWELRTSGLSTPIRIVYGNGKYLSANNAGRVAGSTDAIHWTLRTTNGIGGNLISMLKYENNFYHIGHRNDGYLISTDSIVWERKNIKSISGVGADVSGIVYNSGLYVLSSSVIQTSTELYNDSALITSTTGIIWSSRTTTITSDYINGVAYDGSSYVAVGGGYLEGSLWTQRTSGFGTSTINTISYVNNLYVAGGSSGVLTTSTDAIAWTYRTSGTTSNLADIAYGNNVYVLSSYGSIRTSTDTIVWEARTSGFDPFNNVGPLVYTTFFVGGNATAQINVSTNGVVWTARTSGFSSIITDLIFGDNIYVLGGSGTSISVSTDTIVWTARTTFSGSTNMNLLYAPGQLNSYVASGNVGNIFTSTDTIVWTRRTSGTTNFVGALSYENNTYVIGGSGGTIITSTDAVVWTARTSNTTNGLNGGITYENDLFVIVGSSGTIITSPVFDTKGSISQSTDTISWTARTSGLNETIDLNTITYQNGLYLVGGDSGVIITSTDGTTWKVKSSINSNNINDFVGDNNRLYQNSIITSGTKDYVAVGDVGTVLSGNGEDISRTVEYFYDTNGASTDGVYWTLRTNAGSQFTTNTAALFNDGKFYTTVNDGSTLSVSTDTIAWTLRTIGISKLSFNTEEPSWTRIVYDESDGSYYLGGRQQVYGRVAYSSDGIVWEARDPGVGNSNLNSFGAFNGLLLVGSVGNGHIEVSTDKGITWSRRTTGLGIVTYYDFAYHKGLYVSTTTSSGLVVSTDSISWTLRTTGIVGNGLNLHSTGNYLLFNASLSGKRFVLSSTDTISWEGYNTEFGDDIKAFANSQDTLVVSGNSGLHGTSQSNAYTVVSDGSGINPNLTGSVGSGGLGGRVFGNRFYSWSIRTVSGLWDQDSSSYGGRLLVYHAGKYVLSGNYSNNAIQTSTDSVVWDIPVFDWVGVSGFAHGGPVANNDDYIIWEYNTALWASTDTVVWQLRTTGSNSSSSWASWDGSTYFLSSNGSTGLKVSTDTIHWSLRTVGASQTIYNLIKGGDYYISAGGSFNDAEVFVSTDTISWEERALPSPFDSNDMTALTYSDRDGLYLIGETGDVAVSTDTVVWIIRTTGSGSTFYDLVYANGYYFGGTGSAGAVIYSTDTISWETLEGRFSNDFSKDTGFVDGRYYNVASKNLYFSPKIDYPSFVGNGFSGTRGGGGGGGGYNSITKKYGRGGDGGNGFVRITWW